MKEILGFVDQSAAIKDSLIELGRINFDIEKYKPVLVRFSKEGSTYVYAIPNDIDVKINDMVVLPSGRIDSFTLGEVYATIDQFGSDFFKIIKRYVIETKQQKRETKIIALNLGNKHEGLLKPYFDNIEKDKKKKLILEKLEAEAELANKMSRFELLAATNPTIKKLLQDLEEIK